MIDISVIVCSRNPRPEYLRRTLASLEQQSLSRDRWELLLVDNASDPPLADAWDLSWHPRGRHVRENTLGLTAARLRGIVDCTGALVIFVDDDNVLQQDFLAAAASVGSQYPYLGAFGAGRLEAEFEIPPPPEIRARAHMLAVRSVHAARWTNNPDDYATIPWGAGLCVRRGVADEYRAFVERLGFSDTLDRRGGQLYAGGDDLFSWVAATRTQGFGIFPELRITHLIGRTRLTRAYFLRLIEDHAFSHGILSDRLGRTQPRRMDWFQYAHLALHGLRNGLFSMRCQWAAARGADRAARLVLERDRNPVVPVERRTRELDS